MTSLAEKLINKGRQEGLERGRQEKAYNVVKKLLLRGMPVADVANITEIPEEQILKIKEEMGKEK